MPTIWIFVRCGHRLAQPSTVQGLLDAARPAIAPPLEQVAERLRVALSRSGEAASVSAVDAAIEDRRPLVEGLARILSELPAAFAAPLAVTLVEPLLERVGQLMARPEGPRDRLLGHLLAAELQLLACAVKLLEPSQAVLAARPSPAGPMPAVAVMERSWSLLQSLSLSPWAALPEVGAALQEVLRRGLTACRCSQAELVGTFLEVATSLFQAHGHLGALELVGLVAEFLKDEGATPALASAYAACGSGALALLSPGHESRRLEATRALFEMSDRVLVFAPSVALRVGNTQELVGAAVASLGLREREPLAAVLSWLAHIVGPQDKALQSPAWQLLGPSAWAAVGAVAGDLVNRLCLSMAQTCPRQLSRALAACFAAMLGNPLLGPGTRQVLPELLPVALSPVVQAGNLGPGDLQRVVQAMVRSPPLSRGRFDAFIQDILMICRQESSADVLVAYEM